MIKHTFDPTRNLRLFELRAGDLNGETFSEWREFFNAKEHLVVSQCYPWTMWVFKNPADADAMISWFKDIVETAVIGDVIVADIEKEDEGRGRARAHQIGEKP